jgi:mannitol-1-phosphate/altronate dehydrogenase
MLDTLKIYNELKETLEPQAALKIAEIMGYIYGELANTVTKADFNELREVVRDLAEAQKRTEQRVEELAEAQKRTEKELHLLTQDVRELTRQQKETRRQLGGLSGTVGYTLEDRTYPSLPPLLKNDFGITLKEELKRDFIEDNEGEYIEVNIVGKGLQNGKEILIVGECKTQLSKNDVNDFIRKKLKRLNGVHQNVFPVLVTYMISQRNVAEYARSKGIALYYSYQFRPLTIM